MTFSCNVLFSDKDQILIEYLYVFKGYGAKKLTKEYPIKVGTTGTEQTYEKAARKTGTMARRSGSI